MSNEIIMYVFYNLLKSKHGFLVHLMISLSVLIRELGRNGNYFVVRLFNKNHSYSDFIT